MNNCIRTNLFSAFDCIWLLERLPQVSAQREHTIDAGLTISYGFQRSCIKLALHSYFSLFIINTYYKYTNYKYVTEIQLSHTQQQDALSSIMIAVHIN